MLVIAVALGTTACTGNVDTLGEGEASVIDQTWFNFTTVADRGLFDEQDLSFRQTVGPYAIYEVTGDNPALLGPRVRYDAGNGGLVMLCGAHGFYHPDGAGDGVEMKLYEGEEEQTGMSVQALRIGDCSEARDNFQDRAPSGGGDYAPTDGPFVAGDGVSLGFIGSLPPSSLVLIRIAALDVPARDHNDAPTVPDVCCEGDFCSLAN